MRTNRKEEIMSLPNYAIEIEVVEAAHSVCHQLGEKFRYSDDLGQICPWLRDSLGGFLRTLEMGGTLPWTYAGTPCAKQIDPEGVTTEFVRCPDPTAAGIVVKVIRTRLPDEGYGQKSLKAALRTKKLGPQL